MKRSRKALTRVSVGLGRRTVGAMRVAAKTGVAALRNSDDPNSDARWEHLSGELGRMKGLMMKIGQMASYIEGTLPSEAQPFLAKLQHQSEAMPFEVVVTVVEEDFDRKLADLYDRFETEAIAAASIGQVHRAEFKDAPVAVKVQYPGVVESLDSDLRNLATLMTLGRAVIDA